jgi:hypothetical protein
LLVQEWKLVCLIKVYIENAAEDILVQILIVAIQLGFLGHGLIVSIGCRMLNKQVQKWFEEQFDNKKYVILMKHEEEYELMKTEDNIVGLSDYLLGIIEEARDIKRNGIKC